MAHGRVVLRAGHEPVRPRDALVPQRRLEARAVEQIHAFGALEIDEVIERRPIEGREGDHYAGRVIAGGHGEVRALEVRRRADGREQVGDEREVQHLVDCDVDDGRAPPGHRSALVCAKRAFRALFQAVRGVEVRAHEPVLDLRRLGEQVGELFSLVGDDLGLLASRLVRHRRRSVSRVARGANRA
jgi:hypothetical protein